ncbi:MAG TPA: Fe-S cluster assembly ATPase SufC [Anaerolineae bacterium]|nr:Fe-S cluster assembly ATPase SufC [Anaerolineae bacterium]
MAELLIEDLHVEIEGKKILKGINLRFPQGEVHAIMGPNATGKSTLAYTLMGHPRYNVLRGDILFDGKSILPLSPDRRANVGIFLAFQNPVAIPGVTVANFIRTAINSHRKAQDSSAKGIPIPQFRKLMLEKMELLQIDSSMGGRYLNDGFSGGEKKRVEILQMAMLQPRMAILDETDSGLDIDALRIIAEGIEVLKSPNLGILIITHYQRILNYLKPDVVHIMVDGQIVESGSSDLASKLEQEGYDWVKGENGRRQI